MELAMKPLWIASLALALWASMAQVGASEPFEVEGSLAFAGANPDQYLLAYSSNEVDSGPNIYGRVLASDGSPMGKDFRMSTQTGEMSKPVLAYGALAKRFLVAWGRKAIGHGGTELIGLTVGLDGKILGEEFQLSLPELFNERPAIAYCPARDRFLVTWERGHHYDFENGDFDVYGQLVAGDGMQLLGSNFVIASAAKNQFKSDVTCDAANDRFLVVWEDQRNLETKDDIYGQLVSSDGAMVGGNFLISGAEAIERRPVVAANTRDGTYEVVWESDGTGGSVLVSQKLDPSGRLLGEPVSFGSDIGGILDRPAIAFLPRQNVFLVAFHQYVPAGASNGIYGQFVDGNGGLREGDFPLTTAIKSQFRPNVAASRNTFLVVWTDYRDIANKGSKRDIYEYYGRVIGNDMALSARWRNPESK
jgi:hypothetical protein